MRLYTKIFKKVKISELCVFIFTCALLLSLIICGKTSETPEKTYPKLTYSREILVDTDYTFENEGLNFPILVRENPVNKDIIVLDRGNQCFYVFSQEGEFIRKIGEYRGKGPGDLLDPAWFEVDKEGNIYVFEEGNMRISIFSNEGKYIDSFRVQGDYGDTRFYVTVDQEIVMNNLRGGDYYCTVFSKDGKLLREIGKITKYHESDRVNNYFAACSSFKDSNGNYYIFMQYMPLVKIYDEMGKLLEEKSLTHIPEIATDMDDYIPPEKQSITEGYGPSLVKFYWQIIFRNDKFYLIGLEPFEINDPERFQENEMILYIYELDKELRILKRISCNAGNYVDINTRSEILTRLRGLFFWSVEISHDEKYIIHPERFNSKILRFSP